MSALTAAKRTELGDELTVLETRLSALNTAYTSVLESGMKSYKLDTGEGSQSATYMNIDDLQKNIDLVASQIASKKRVLTGGNMRRFTLNRKPNQSRGLTDAE